MGMSNDLAMACGLDPFTWLLPGTPVDHQTRSEQPAPFAPPPLQELHHYYEAVRPPATHRYYLCPSQFQLFGVLPYRQPAFNPTGGSIMARGSHVPHWRLSPSSRHLHAGPPPGQENRNLPDSSRGNNWTPVSATTHTLTTLQQWFTRVRLLGTHLTHLVRLFRSAHHPGSFTGATCGGLRPPPAWAVSEGLPPSPVQHHVKSFRLHQNLLLCSWRTIICVPHQHGAAALRTPGISAGGVIADPCGFLHSVQGHVEEQRANHPLLAEFPPRSGRTGRDPRPRPSATDLDHSRARAGLR
ncbi:hypothetical protein ABIE67_009489 [Streptomyces sp. V4I8]